MKNDLFYIIKSNCADNGIALSSPEVEISYAKYLDWIVHIAQILAQKGINSGDQVGIYYPTSWKYPILFFSIHSLGAITVPINTSFKQDLLADIQHNLSLDWLLSKNGKSGLNIDEISIEDLFPDHYDTDQIPHKQLSTLTSSFEKPFDIMLTSGSSGKMKGVIHSGNNHYFSGIGAHTNIPFINNDKWLMSLPMFHVSGLSLLFRAIIAGGTIVFPDEKLNMSESVKKYDITHLSLVPTQLYRLLEKDFNIKDWQKVRCILLGGGPIPPTLLHKCIELNLPVFISYGSTEMASQIATSQVLRDKSDIAKGGKVLPHRELKLAPDKEIMVKGRTLFLAYVDKGKKIVPFDKDGWFYTGDVGELDKHSYIRIAGRKDNMFICAGENTHPEEVEKALSEIIGIELAIVTPVPDKEYGERPVAFVRTRHGYQLTNEEILSSLKSKLPGIKIPVKLYSIDKYISPYELKPNRLELSKIGILLTGQQ